MSITEHPLLDYAAPPSRRWVRRAGILIALTAAVLCGLNWWKPILWRLEFLYFQQQCLHYQAATDAIVYDNAPLLTAIPGPPQVSEPQCLSDLMGLRLSQPSPLTAHAASGLLSPAVLFLHECRNSRGESRLVVILCSRSETPALNGPESLSRIVVSPATLTRLPSFHNSPGNGRMITGGPRCRFFAGQPDPHDSSRFTIRCVVTQSKVMEIEHVIDGWLLDNDTVKLVARDPLSEWGEWQGPSGKR